MKSLCLLLFYLIFIVLGFYRPYIFTLGYIWVDLVKPQNLAYSYINGKPLSMIIAGFILTSLVFQIKKNKNHFNISTFLLIIFSVWITCTSLLSDLQLIVWTKWDYAIKSVLFASIIPLIFKTRIQIEAMLQVINFSIANIYISGGIKTLVSGGGYGVWQENSGLTEGSTLSMICVAMIAVNLYLRKNSILIQNQLYANIIYIGLTFLCAITIIGTYARTGLIVFIAYIAYSSLILSKSKIRNFIIFIVIFVVIWRYLPESWLSRMNTINTYEQDNSAMGRIAVWQWTLEYITEHPMGGGFLINTINDGIYDGTYIHGKAFHNIYFEVLGEQGIFGLFIYLLLLFITFHKFSKLQVETKKTIVWISELAQTCKIVIIILMIGGLTIGIAYQPYIFYFIGLSICLNNYYKNYQPNEK